MIHIMIDGKWYEGSDNRNASPLLPSPVARPMPDHMQTILNNVAERAKIERRYSVSDAHYVFCRYGVDGSPITRSVQIVNGDNFDFFVEDIEKHDGFTVEDGGLVRVLFNGNLHDCASWHICKDGFIGDEE
jgi:hypothetical protein